MFLKKKIKRPYTADELAEIARRKNQLRKEEDKRKETMHDRLVGEARIIAYVLPFILIGVAISVIHVKGVEMTTKTLESITVIQPIIIENETKTIEKEIAETETEEDTEPITGEAVGTGGAEKAQDTIRRVAREKGAGNLAEQLVKIAKCETGGLINGQIIPSTEVDPSAKSSISSATGPFQYLKGTWEEGVRLTGNDWSLDDRHDLEKATRMAIWHINRGQIGKWSESQHCWG